MKDRLAKLRASPAGWNRSQVFLVTLQRDFDGEERLAASWAEVRDVIAGLGRRRASKMAAGHNPAHVAIGQVVPGVTALQNWAQST